MVWQICLAGDDTDEGGNDEAYSYQSVALKNLAKVNIYLRTLMYSVISPLGTEYMTLVLEIQVRM